MAVLVVNVLPQFSYEIVGLFRPSAYGLTFVSDTNSLVMPFTSSQGQHFSRMMPLLMSSTLKSSAIRRQLDYLCIAGYHTCFCCVVVRVDLEFQRIFEFLTWLCKEFEPWHAQLFASVVHVSLLKALT